MINAVALEACKMKKESAATYLQRVTRGFNCTKECPMPEHPLALLLALLLQSEIVGYYGMGM